VFEQIHRKESVCDSKEVKCWSCNCKAHFHGSQPNGVLRWRCPNNSCDVVTFNSRYGTIRYRMKIDDKDLYEIVYLFFTGYPISDMVCLKEYTEKTIRNNLIKCIEHFTKFEDLKINYDDYVPEVIEVDEIYIKIQGHRQFYGWIAYDPVNKFIIDLEIGKRDEETLEKLFKRISIYRSKVKLIMIDGYKNYETLIKKYLSKNGHMPNTGVINKSRYVKELDGFLTYGYFGKSRSHIEGLVIKYGLGKKISTAMIERLNREIRDKLAYMRRRSARMPRLLKWGEIAMEGYKFFHNVLKPHLTLSEKSSKNWIINPITPSMKANLLNKFFSIEEVLCHPTLK